MSGLKMVIYKCSILVLILFSTNIIESARILGVFPIPSISHQVVFRSLTKELAKRGHDVVVITTDPAFKDEKAPANYTEIDVHDVSYKTWKEMLDSVTGASQGYNLLTTFLKMMVDIVKVQLETPQVKELMVKDQEFDLVITEACVPTSLVFGHKYKTPVIQMSSFYGSSVNYDSMGAPTHMFLYPELYRQKLRDLTLWDKVLEVIIESVLKFAYIGYVDEVNRTLKRYFGNDTPSLHELEDKIDMLFVNTNPVWEGNRPVPSSVVFLGGLHMQPVKQLPNDLKSYLDASRGVIYVSFGTNFSPSTLPEDKIHLLLNVFSKLPHDVLCKWDTDDVPGRPSNVRIVKWVPQNDLLRHPKIKLFITQGGMQSTDEAIAAGVPLIGIPILVDQFFNTEKYIQHSIGEKLIMEKLTEEEFHKTILKVLENDSYRQNVVKLRTLMHDQPMSPLDRAVWWTEHVLRHGGARHLRAPAANIGWAEYLELPLVATILTIIIIISLISIISFCLFVKMLRKLCSAKSKKD